MSTTSDQFVVGLFQSRAEADRVVQELGAAGFDDGHISTTHHGPTTGLVGYLEKHGVPESHSHYYAEGVRRGGSLVKLFTDRDHVEQAVGLMKQHGAVDMRRLAQQYKSEGFTRHDENAAAVAEAETQSHRDRYESHSYDESDAVLPEIEEQVTVGKQKVETGGVRIFARKTEVPVEKHVTLREEHVDVTRKPVDRPATAADLENFKEGEVTLTETAEKAVVSKEARVTGEVHVDKEVVERDETVHETATKTEVEVDRTAANAKT